MSEKIFEIGELAVESILYEVSATPKPGLVDRANCGAHEDMDFFSFMSSAAALRNYFDECAAAGAYHSFAQIKDLLPTLQELGLAAEQRMFRATNGVNTHKGIIFSLGILSGLCGLEIGRGEKISAARLGSLAAEMCCGLCKKNFASLDVKNHLTKGERMFLKYGVTGIRGEVESGFPTVMKISLPVYRHLRDSGVNVNDALVETFMHLLAFTVDTNILSRHDFETLGYVQAAAKKILNAGLIRTPAGLKKIQALDEDFIRRWISPGGSADLLAVTHFLDSLRCC